MSQNSEFKIRIMRNILRKQSERNLNFSKTNHNLHFGENAGDKLIRLKKIKFKIWGKKCQTFS